MLPLLIVGALLVLGLIWWWVVHPHGHHAHAARDLPLPLFATRTPGRGVRIVGPGLALGATAPEAAQTAPRRGSWSDGGGAAAAERQTSVAEHAAAAPPAPVSAPVKRPVVTNGNGRGEEEFPSPRGQPVGARASVGTTEPSVERWGPPTTPSPAGTVQFLPGRLEVVQGRGVVGQEVRFVRPERPTDRAVVTFGRAEGPPYRHVQLKVPTVSRLHARMSLEPGSGTWRLENLSSTNPVSVNGADLPEGAPAVALADGDRVEMGEVVFTFRAR